MTTDNGHGQPSPIGQIISHSTPEIISDDEIRAHLTSVGLDPTTQPAFCATEVSRHWNLPVAVAAQMVAYLR